MIADKPMFEALITFTPKDFCVNPAALLTTITMNATWPLPAVVLTWITDHPYQSVFHAFNGIILCTPAAVTVPIFSVLGFGAVGPTAGTPTL
jgi:hypothetical protein